MIIIEVENIYSKISGLSTSLYHKLDGVLSFYVTGYQFSKAYTNGYYDRKTKKWERWDGKKHLLKSIGQGQFTFYTGLLKKVGALVKNSGEPYQLKDLRPEVKFGRKLKTRNMEAREYQDQVLRACLHQKSGIVKSCTGSGKTCMIARLVAETNVKTMIYVISCDLLYQTKEALENFLSIKVGMIGDGRADVRKVNVCSIYTAVQALGKKYKTYGEDDYFRSRKEKVDAKNKAKIAKAIRESQMLIVDECQICGTSTLETIYESSKSARHCFGFSGTPFREDNADLIIHGICGGQEIVEISASELIKKGYLVQPKIRFINVPEMPNLPDRYQSIYKAYIVENEVRNDKIVKAAERLIELGRQVLILVRQIKHGEILLEKLEDKFDTYFLNGEIDSEERNRVRKEFVNGEIKLLIASTIFDMGIDIKSLSALILAGSGKSSGRALQRIGRVIRPDEDKKDAIVVDFIDKAKYLTQHSYERLKVYRVEPSFQIKLPKNPYKSTKKPKTRKGW